MTDTNNPAPAQDARGVVAKHLEALEAWFSPRKLEEAATSWEVQANSRAAARTGLALRALRATPQADTVSRLVEAGESLSRLVCRAWHGNSIAVDARPAIAQWDDALAAHRASPDAIGAGRGGGDGIQFAAQLDELHAVGAEARHKGEPKDAPKHLNNVERFAWELGWDYGCKVRERNVFEKERDEAKANAVAFRSQRDSAINEADAAHGRCDTLRQDRDRAIAERDEARKERDRAEKLLAQNSAHTDREDLEIIEVVGPLGTRSIMQAIRDCAKARDETTAALVQENQERIAIAEERDALKADLAESQRRHQIWVERADKAEAELAKLRAMIAGPAVGVSVRSPEETDRDDTPIPTPRPTPAWSIPLTPAPAPLDPRALAIYEGAVRLRSGRITGTLGDCVREAGELLRAAEKEAAK